MRNSYKECDAAVRRAKRLPKGTLTERRLDFAPQRARETSPKVLAARAAFLPRGGAQPSKAEFERLLGTNDLVDEFYLERALLAAHPVCRLSIRAPSGHERGYATGFMVSPRLLLTNEHVFGSADEAAPSIAEFNYRFDIAGRPESSYRFRLRPDLFFFNNEQLDFALVAVETQSSEGDMPLSTFGYHRLLADGGKALLKEWMTIIQHPGGARRQFAIRENQCVDDKDPDVIWYKSDTAQGSSGSPVLNDSFQVVALHHAGVARKDAKNNFILKSGKKVKDLSDADDSEVDWIANAGIRVSRMCGFITQQAPEQNGHLAEFKAAMQGGDILSNAYKDEHQSPGAIMNPRINTTNNGGRLVLGTLVLELGGGIVSGQAPVITGQTSATPPGLVDGTSSETETFKVPIIDTDYKTRTGFNKKFLGIETPLPRVTNQSVVAPMLDGRKVIPYEHFSVVLHKERKLAIYAATNVDGSAKAKKPEAGKDYSRKSLTGLGKNDIEKWALDPRVDAAFQIPDNFYTKDNGAFDKGHICRRDDVCFGMSFAQVQRANGDTYHVTNCSPQRGNFNQSGKSGIWGKLENFIGAQADKEQYCIFAGPVLSTEDETFVGTERVKLPKRFWKVVCAVKDKKLQVFAFVLKQDIKDLPLEFQVTAEWKHKRIKLADLEKLLGIVKFQKKYHDADQA